MLKLKFIHQKSIQSVSILPILKQNQIGKNTEVRRNEETKELNSLITKNPYCKPTNEGCNTDLFFKRTLLTTILKDY
jgi:hypothetical protein